MCRRDPSALSPPSFVNPACGGERHLQLASSRHAAQLTPVGEIIRCARAVEQAEPSLEARASVVHQGQRMSVVRTEIMRSDGRRVLEVMSTHVRPGNIEPL